MVEALQWFIGLGSTVFLPIIIIIIALFFGVKLYLKKKKDAPIIIDATDRIIEEKEDK